MKLFFLCIVLISVVSGVVWVSNSNFDNTTYKSNEKLASGGSGSDSNLMQKQISKDVFGDSVPISNSFNEALTKIFPNSSLEKGTVDKNIAYRISKKSSNNYGLNYYANQFFTIDMNLGPNEFVSSIDGKNKLVSTVRKETENLLTHKVYNENYKEIANFDFAPIGFESSESVTLCFGGKIIIDDISGLANGYTLHLYDWNSKKLNEYEIDKKFDGVGVKCINDVLYVITYSNLDNATTVFEIVENGLAEILSVPNFHAGTDIAHSNKNEMLFLSDQLNKNGVIVNLKSLEQKKISISGNLSSYDSEFGSIVIGESRTETSIAVVNSNGELVSSYHVKGAVVGFSTSSVYEKKSIQIHDKSNRKIKSIDLKGREEKVISYKAKNKFDEIVFVWNGILIDLKSAFGL